MVRLVLELWEHCSVQLGSIHSELVERLVELFTALIDLFLAYESPDRNCLWARFYDLSIDPKLLMHRLPLS